MATLTRSILTHEPDYENFDYKREYAAVDKARALYAKGFRNANKGDLVGEIIKFPVADGYAEYMVESERPLKLVHLADWDEYSIPPAHIRGLRLTDVRALAESERTLAALFAKKI